MAIYGYCRVSSLKQPAEAESLDVQRRQIKGYGLMHGLVVDLAVVQKGIKLQFSVAPLQT
jgi:putative DNA-invertase from lambdoid prophage Rac